MRTVRQEIQAEIREGRNPPSGGGRRAREVTRGRRKAVLTVGRKAGRVGG